MSCRVVTKNTLGQPVDFYWPYRMDFRFSLSLSVDDESEYTLDGKSITFIIKDKLADSGVYMLEQGLTDGNIQVDGLTITGDIPFADLDAAGIVEGGEYEYGLTIGEPIDGNRIQGLFFALDETGYVEPGCNTFSLSLSDFTASLTAAGIGPRGLRGEQGEAGPAGDWYADAVWVSASGTVPTDTVFVLAQPSGGNINLSDPDPAELWDGSNGKRVVVEIPLTIGGVEISGTVTFPDQDDFQIFPGESVYFTTTDGVDLIFGVSSVVAIVTTDINNKIGDVALPPSIELAGMPRYTETETGSKFSICMKNSFGEYEWVDIAELQP